MHENEVILYVDDQDRATSFYGAVLGLTPTLHVPGMTEFDLGGVTLGLMPLVDIIALVPGITPPQGQRAELYVRRLDAQAVLDQIPRHGGRILAPLEPRPWGEDVGYGLDPDGHVLAVARVWGQ